MKVVGTMLYRSYKGLDLAPEMSDDGAEVKIYAKS